jgi:uncharacterized DUF497 family protein
VSTLTAQEYVPGRNRLSRSFYGRAWTPSIDGRGYWRFDLPVVGWTTLRFVYTKLVFEWDPRKADANANKHGVSFDDAVTVFLDPNALDGPDLQHSSAEARFRRLGQAADGRVLMVAYTSRRTGDAEAIRLISARRASRRERSAYRAKD